MKEAVVQMSQARQRAARDTTSDEESGKQGGLDAYISESEK
jgi:hypothetical protein